MRQLWIILFLLTAAPALAQNQYPYIIRNFAGAFPLGDGGPAVTALLDVPAAAVADTAGNLFIMESSSNALRMRKVSPDGVISTAFRFFEGYHDLQIGPDGSLYAIEYARIVKFSPTGFPTVIAGNGTAGFSGDNGPATEAQITALHLAIDGAGNLYFTSGNRIRQVTASGTIRTIAGATDAGFSGDNGPAVSARFYTPSGIAVDASGAIYVADANNFRIRKFTVGGTITTIAGTGGYARPFDGPARTTPIGSAAALAVDRSGNLFVLDIGSHIVLKISPDGALTRVAGNYERYGALADGPARSVSLDDPQNLTVDAAGNVWIADHAHVVRKITPGGLAVTVAGRPHFGGDNGPAAAALLNWPWDIAIDRAGNTYLLDNGNFLLRKIAPDGTITTYGGKRVPGTPLDGSPISASAIPEGRALRADASGALYLASDTQIFRISPQGIVTLIAGNGVRADTGDGGPALSASFYEISSMAIDPSGNIYVSEGLANRIRRISAGSGTVRAFAGTGVQGRGGDGGPALNAQLDLQGLGGQLAVDARGNVYISDTGNNVIRMVNPAGIISTVVGNGHLGVPADGAPATATNFYSGSMVFDAAGDLYIASLSFEEIYKVSGGIIRRIAGAQAYYPADGRAALDAYVPAWNLAIDANGDLYAVDPVGNTVRKLVLNSPVAFETFDGDGQTGPVGQFLAKPLTAVVRGRAGAGVSGMTIEFAVKSGDAHLSATRVQSDAAGSVSIAVNPLSAGPVVITATAVGTNLPPLEFTATATPHLSFCSVPVPTVVSARSAGDFGGSSTFASASWLEIKGANLSGNTRSWAGSDFNGSSAPTTLDNVTVTINNRRAFVGYISPTQINIQAPADTATGPLDLVVTYSGCPSEPFRVQKAAVAGGLLAPGVFNPGGTQYAAALFQDGVTFVGQPGLIAGVPFRAAKPGDIITLYGIGFGDVSPNIAPGTIVSAANSIPGLTLSFGSTPATVSYAGLAPNAVGLYQFNVIVPDVTGDQQIVVKVNGEAIQQTAYLTVVR